MRFSAVDEQIITILKNDRKRQREPPLSKGEYQYDKMPGRKEKAFGALFVGSTGQGKTHMIKRLLSDPKFYGKAPNGNRPGDFFDILIIVSSSIKVEDEYDCFEEGRRVFKRTPDEFPTIMESLKAQQEKFHNSKSDRPRMPRICIILDDCIHLGIFGYKQGGLSEWMYAVGRHYLIYPFITTQYLKAVSPIIRNNCKLICCFKVFELAELEKFIDGWFPKRDRDLARERMLELYDERYSFIACLPDNIYSERFYVNLQTPLLAGAESESESEEEEEEPAPKRRKKE